MVGEAGLHVPASYESLALKRRVRPGLVTRPIRDAAVLRARVVAAHDVIGQQFVVHHLPSPRPATQRQQEAVPSRLNVVSSMPLAAARGAK